MLRNFILYPLLMLGSLSGAATTAAARPASDAPKVDVGLPLAGEDDGVVRAFPGAEGGGMYATGGRGGKVYHVTKLTDDGSEGTLRYAVRKSGPRTIVFDVAGTIDLASELSITKGDLTIAGQTAPGDGICLRNYAVKIAADNVIVRFVRFRLGDATKGEQSPQEDCVGGRFHENIIFDHCSMSWSMDECASFYGNRNFTMQWCLIAESLNASGHPKGEHGYGGIWGGRNASFHHNLLAHNKSRNARLDHPKIYGGRTATHRGNVDFRNNVIYNWLDNLTYGGEDGRFNIVGNYYKPGPASRVRNYFVDADALYAGDKAQHYDYPRLHVAGNYHAGSYAAAINADNWQGILLHDGPDVGRAETMRLAEPLPIRADDVRPCRVTTHDAATAFDRVTEYAGASLRRDAVDRRAVTDARSGSATCLDGGNGSTGGIVDTQEAVGGWPELKASRREIARAAVDTDGDGIPDWYEKRLGLDPADAADGAAATLDPQGLYTNLEVYLHFLVREIVAAQRRGGTYVVQEQE
ncbi:MAG: pectate lyase [Alistipes sp.]|nr:pectate lyase [Alistipes sp.]